MGMSGTFSSGRTTAVFVRRLTAIVLVAALTAQWNWSASAEPRETAPPASSGGDARPALADPTVIDPRSAPGEPSVRLPGHVLAILRQATPVALAPGAGAEPITLMIALNRADQAGFDRYLRDVYDPHSPNFRRFLSQPEITARFGPTQDAYDDVLAYLQQQGFTLVQGSANRLTLTVRGTRAQAERAFGIRIREFTTGARRFFANEEDPTLPAHLGSHVQAVVGLSDFGQPRGAQGSDPSLVQTIASSFARGAGAGLTLIGLSIEQVAALCESDPVLAELLRRAGSALSLLVAVQSASAMLSPPKPSK